MLLLLSWVNTICRLIAHQSKKQREELALLVAILLEVRGDNLVGPAASLPRAATRLEKRNH